MRRILLLGWLAGYLAAAAGASYPLLVVRPQAAPMGRPVAITLRTPPGICILSQSIEYGDGQASPYTAEGCLDDMQREHRYHRRGHMTVRGQQRDTRGRVWRAVAWVVIS